MSTLPTTSSDGLSTGAVPDSYEVAAGTGTWVDVFGDRLAEPFTVDALARLRRDGARHGSFDVSDLLGFCDDAPPSPAAFILHPGRSGSTLLANALGVIPGTVVFREHPVINTLEIASRAGDAELMQLLRAMLDVLSAPVHLGCNQVIHKFASTSTRLAEILRHWYPGVPIVFIGRQPIDVVISYMVGRPAWVDAVLADPSLLRQLFPYAQLDPPSQMLDLHVFAASWLNEMNAIMSLDAEALLLDYAQLVEAPHDTLDRVLEFVGLELGAADLELARGSLQRYSKSPGVRWKPHARDTLGPEIVARVEAEIGPLTNPTWQKYISHLRH